MSNFAEDCLKAHNRYRAQHKAPPLKLNQELCEHAQRWADHMASKGVFGHSQGKCKSGERMGENIFMAGGTAVTGQSVTDTWYSEQKNYNFIRGGFQSGTGHFTQVVWRSSTDFGVGMAQGKNNSVYVVGNYVPAGNMMRAYEDNVKPRTIQN